MTPRGWTTCCVSLRPLLTAPTAPSRSSWCSVAPRRCPHRCSPDARAASWSLPTPRGRCGPRIVWVRPTRPPLLVLDPNLRVLASLVLQDATATAHQVLALLDACLPPVVPLEITTPAPVLLIPDALDQELCQSLIHVWETQGHVATGVEQSRGARREATLNL